MGDAHKCANDTKCESESREPKSRGGEFEGDIARDLEQDVADKVDGQCSEVLVSGLFQKVVRVKLAEDTGEKRHTHV